MSIADLLEKFAFQTNSEDTKYLKQSIIGDVVIKGLTETYLNQPKNPIKYLANWLLNEHKSSLILEKQKEKELTKIKYIKKKNEQDTTKIREREENDKKILENSLIRKNFIEKIKSNQDIEDNLNQICFETETILAATGVYVYFYDKKRKPVSLLDGENAHLGEVNVLRIINFSNSHEFMKGKYLELEEGVTIDVFNPKEEKDGVDIPNNMSMDNIIDEKQKPLNETMKHFLIDEVIRNPKAKFFKEPKLGCYLVVDISYQSCINENSLESSIINYKEYLEEQKQILEERKIKIQDLRDLVGKQIDNEKLDTNRDNDDKNMDADHDNDGMEDKKKDEVEMSKEKDSDKIFLDNVVKLTILDQEGNQVDIESLVNDINSKIAVLKDYEKIEKKIAFCLDTLGQDRVFSQEDINYVLEICDSIIKTRELQENNRLIKMRVLRMENIKAEKDWLEANPFEKLPDMEEAEFKKYYFEKHDGNPPKDDENKEEDSLYFRTRFFIKNLLQDDEVLFKLFQDFNKYEFVEHTGLFQIILLFCGHSNIDINYPETNKLNWKVARKYWTPEILKHIEKYQIYGPKPDNHDNKLIKLNRLISVLSEFEEEKVREYSFVMSRLLEAMKLCKSNY